VPRRLLYQRKSDREYHLDRILSEVHRKRAQRELNFQIPREQLDFFIASESGSSVRWR
jgi:hypothetical protein